MIKIFYPRGCGGSWLSNLIWHLEHADTTLPQVDVVFDSEPRGSVKVSHAFEIYDPYRPDEVFYYKRLSDDKLFSCQYLFNHYINNAIKVKYHIEGLGKQSFQKQLFALSNGARYYLANEHYRKYYCENIDLDYSLIFQDPDQFVNCLFRILNDLKKHYTPDRGYVLKSIEHYRSTCPNPTEHFGNLQSLLWLGCCHAITIMDQLPINGIIEPDVDMRTAIELLQPYTEHCKNKVRNEMFEWKK